MHISLNIKVPDMKLLTGFRNILLEGSVSQNLIYALVFILCQKTGNFLTFFKTFFARFHKMKTRA